MLSIQYFMRMNKTSYTYQKKSNFRKVINIAFLCFFCNFCTYQDEFDKLQYVSVICDYQYHKHMKVIGLKHKKVSLQKKYENILYSKFGTNIVMHNAILYDNTQASILYVTCATPKEIVWIYIYDKIRNKEESIFYLNINEIIEFTHTINTLNPEIELVGNIYLKGKNHSRKIRLFRTTKKNKTIYNIGFCD